MKEAHQNDVLECWPQRMKVNTQLCSFLAHPYGEGVAMALV